MTRTPFKLILSTFLMLLLAVVATSPVSAAPPQIKKPKISIVSVNQIPVEEFNGHGVSTTLQWAAVEGADFYRVCTIYNNKPSPRGEACQGPIYNTTYTYESFAQTGTRITYYAYACDDRGTTTAPVCSDSSNKVSVISGKTK